MFGLCGGVCCIGALMCGWLTISHVSKLPFKTTLIGGIILCVPFCLGGFFIGKYMFLDEQLVIASHNGDLEQMKMLLDMGADPNVVSEFGTPICSALVSRQLKAVKLLADRGADLNKGCMDASVSLGNPLDIVADLQAWELADYLKKKGAKRMFGPSP